MKEQKFDTGALQLDYVETNNDGIPLLLLHGGSSRWQTIGSMIPDLEKYSRVYALDLRGHGQSDKGDNYKINSYVEDIAAFIEKHIQQPTVIFGHSLGGMIGIMLAATHPSLVRGLIIGDSPFNSDVLKSGDNSHVMKWKEMIEQGLSAEEITEELKNGKIYIPEKNKTISARELYGENDPYFESMGISLSQNDPAMLDSVNNKVDENFADYKIEKLFPEIKCPVLVLQGDPEHGGLIKDEDINTAETLLQNVRCYKCKNIGHGLYLEDKEQIVSQLVSFLKEQKNLQQ
jgi:pimeloyl-ACP methyl ester carboxylesterase